MKKVIFLIPMLSTLLWARGKYDETLNPADEGAIAACYLNRPDVLNKPHDGNPTNEAEVLNKIWLRYPSHELHSKLMDATTDPDIFEYVSAYCEEALHRVLMDMGGGTSFLSGRCQTLATKHENFIEEMQSDSNTYIRGRSKIGAETDAEQYWCQDNEPESDLMRVACAYREANRVAYNQKHPDYKKAKKELQARCGQYIKDPNRSGSRGLASEPYLERRSPHQGGAILQPHAPVVIPRYIQVPPGQWGGCQQSRGLNVINIQPSMAHTLMTGVLGGLGAYLSYKGQSQVDEYTYKLASQNMKINQQLGAATMFSAGAGGPWGPGGVMPMNGGMPGMGAGMCGRPPFNTAHTGCMGGMPGMPVVGGNNRMCGGFPCGGMNGGGCSPGTPCFGGGQGGICQPGMANCVPGMPMPGMPGQGIPGGGCPSGNCNPNYPGNYMNNPAHMGRPGGMYGYNPYSLEAEKQRIQELQNQAQRQLEDARKAQQYNQQLADIDRQRRALDGDFNTALQGYNGILANRFGPAPAYGNPGMYQGPGQPNMGGCGGAAGAGGMGNCACTSVMCYPGQQSAYYAPPMVVGNSGMGGAQYGYPDRGTNNFFHIGVGWTSITKKSNSFNAR